ncbi:MAG: glycosyltransferase [Sphingopyxis sp.]
MHSDGIGDYAAAIAGALRDNHGLVTHFIVARPDATTHAVDDGFATIALDRPAKEGLLTALETAHSGDAAALIVHISGYGYARYGAPFWLARAMARWKRQQGRSAPIIGVFHELFSEGAPWDRRYWYGLGQKRFVRAMAVLCDHVITPTQVYADWLNTHGRLSSPPIVLPVVSNVGEAAAPSGDTQRRNRLAIFARSGAAEEIYSQWRAQIGQAVRAYGIEEIVDIGTRANAPPASIGGATVTAHGRLAVPAIAELLGTCRVGFLSYRHMPLAKSTILAAYAAHGVLPLCAADDASPQDGLVAGNNFVHVSGMSEIAPIQPQQEADMQRCISAWYAQHDTAAQASLTASLVGGEERRP